jgi:hypothetical protein
MDPLRSRLVQLEESVPVHRNFEGGHMQVSTASRRRKGLLLAAGFALVPVLIIGLVAVRLSGSGSDQLTRVDFGAYAVYYNDNGTTSVADIPQSDAEARALSAIQWLSHDSTVYRVTNARLLHGVSRIESSGHDLGFVPGEPIDAWVIEVKGTTPEGWNADGMVVLDSKSGKVESQNLMKTPPDSLPPATPTSGA